MRHVEHAALDRASRRVVGVRPVWGGQGGVTDSEVKDLWRLAGKYSAVGIELAVAIALGYFGGEWIDGKIGTAPYLKWIGLACGIVAGFKGLYDAVRTTDLDKL